MVVAKGPKAPINVQIGHQKRSGTSRSLTPLKGVGFGMTRAWQAGARRKEGCRRGAGATATQSLFGIEGPPAGANLLILHVDAIEYPWLPFFGTQPQSRCRNLPG